MLEKSNSPQLTRRRLLGGTVGGAALGLGTISLGSFGVAACSDSDSSSTSGSPQGTGGTSPGNAGGIPQPVDVVRSNWSLDPFAFGSYSYLPVGATPEARSALAEPIAGRIFFAGEATSRTAPATVHGARGEGFRVADSLRAVGTAGERVVVVGAGICGATAARELMASGYVVSVVEARDRVGGRLYSVQPKGWGLPAEVGASWVHDRSTNAELIEELGRLEITSTPWDWEDETAVNRARTRDTSGAVAQESERVSELIARAVEQAAEAETDISMAAAIDEFGDAVGNDVDEVALARVLKTEIATEFAADAEDLSAYYAFEEGTEGEDQLVTGGYMNLAEGVLEGAELRLGHPVSMVRLSQGEVELVGPDGASILADRVVITVPLGVLQSENLTFEPELPATHVEAIASLGMGLLDKLWLRFDKPFWTEPAAIWTLGDPGDSPFGDWYNLAAINGSPILLGLMGGASARAWSAKSEPELLAAAMLDLEQFVNAGW